MIATWDNRLMTGDRAIDAEHRVVLNLLNELHVASTVRAPMVVVQKALESMTGIVDRHFARCGPSPGGDHTAFAAAVHRLAADWRSGAIRDLDRRTLMNLARRWIDHIGRHEAPGRLAG
ncbi:MAG: hypothetical protein J0626_12465 [Rhodospirillaceae bacterium]|nr:hypothetical protein [Rhodospirillaceae bacterium]